MRGRTLGVLLVPALAAAAACVPRWGAHPSQRAAPSVEPFSSDDRSVLFYADLGPDRVDVSSYPARQQANYALFLQSCSRCHTPARAINSPTASRGFWEMYMLGMRTIARAEGAAPMAKEEREAILDFLEYDGRVRKVENAKAFDAQTEELKRRYEPLFRERLRRLQRSRQPVILREY